MRSKAEIPALATGLEATPSNVASLASGATPFCSRPLTARRGGSWLLRLLGILSLTALWFACRPYIGVDGDARLYVGRVLADLDPRGVGLDLAFAHDGQSRFSVFPHLLSLAVGRIGVGPGAMAVTVAGMCLWLASAAFLLSRFFSGRLLWAGLVCVAVLPPAYGGFAMFEWAEAVATPRIFAEALGLGALGLLVDGRRFFAVAVIIASAAFHPIMALPVLAAGLVFLGLGDCRWFLLLPAAAAAGLAAASAGAPLTARLFTAVDPLWLRVIVARSPQVLPLLWPANSFGPAACHAATLLIAWSLADRRLRRILVAVTLVGVAGTIIAAAAPTQLIMQLQLWRALWLSSMFAAASFAFCGAALWRRGGASRAALALLAIAWIGLDNPVVSGVAGLGAIALRFGWAGRPFPERWVWITWGMAAVFAAATLVSRGALVIKTFSPFPAEYQWSMTTWLRSGAQVVVGGGAALAIAIGLTRLDRPAGRALAVATTAVLALVTVVMWDDEPSVTRARVADVGAAPLRAVLADGSVYWLDSSGTNWLWTGRPEWWSQTQGAGVVFDRQLALIWDHRLTELIAAGLLTPADRFIYQAARKNDPVVTLGALSKLCRDPDGPQWIVSPVGRVQGPALSMAVDRWRAPATEYHRGASATGVLAARDFAIFDCRTFKASAV